MQAARSKLTRLRRAAWVALAVALLPSASFVHAEKAQTPVSLPHSIVYPLMGARISSSFGTRNHPVLKVTRHHGGVDLAAPVGAPIRSIKNGTVVFADPHGGYGNLVVIQHKDGFTSHYGHCDTIKVRPGQKVRGGDIIATVGATGRVTGPHLHLEIRHEGIPIDPETLIENLASAGEG